MPLTNPTAKQKNERVILQRVLAETDWEIEIVHAWGNRLELEYKLRHKGSQADGVRAYCFAYGAGIPPLTDEQIELLFRQQLEAPCEQRTA